MPGKNPPVPGRPLPPHTPHRDPCCRSGSGAPGPGSARRDRREAASPEVGEGGEEEEEEEQEEEEEEEDEAAMATATATPLPPFRGRCQPAHPPAPSRAWPRPTRCSHPLVRAYPRPFLLPSAYQPQEPMRGRKRPADPAPAQPGATSSGGKGPRHSPRWWRGGCACVG